LIVCWKSSLQLLIRSLGFVYLNEFILEIQSAIKFSFSFPSNWILMKNWERLQLSLESVLLTARFGKSFPSFFTELIVQKVCLLAEFVGPREEPDEDWKN